jgi:hypothetical protein
VPSGVSVRLSFAVTVLVLLAVLAAEIVTVPARLHGLHDVLVILGWAAWFLAGRACGRRR